MDLNVSCAGHVNKHQSTLPRYSIIDSLAILIKKPLLEKCKENIRFKHMAASPRGDRICSSDAYGNVFMFNFDEKCYWCVGTEYNICAIEFAPCHNRVTIGCGTGLIKTLKFDTGKQCGVFVRHRRPIKHICYNELGDLCLSICSHSCFVWDTYKYVTIFSFEPDPKVYIEEAQFIPWHEQFLLLTNDNIFSVWGSRTGNIVRRFYALDNPQYQVNKFIFNRNGTVMIICGISNKLTALTTSNWALKKIYTLPQDVKSIKNIEFMPSNNCDQGHSIVGLISQDNRVMLYNLGNCNVITISPTNDECITHFHINHSGQYFVGLMGNGTIGIFHIPLWENPRINITNKVEHQGYYKVNKSLNKKISFTKSQMGNFIRGIGKFPDDVRCFLWQKVLSLPINNMAYKMLCNKNEDNTFKNHSNYKFLTIGLQVPVLRLASNLAHWSPLFSQFTCLPLMVLRFAKLFKNEPLLAFEVVASIVVNYCQFWFNDFPLMPKTITQFLENIIKECDMELWGHFNKFNMRLTHCIWTIMGTLFSEILSEKAWLAFWDNVIINRTDFLTLAVAGFFITNRTLFLKCNTQNQFETLIHKPVDMNITLFVEKTKYLSSTLKSESMFNEYKPLTKGEVYQPF